MVPKSLDRILVIEDDPDIRLIVVLALETVGGFNVDACSGGYQAVERARIYQPDLILLDVMMPEMDGPAMLLALRQASDTASIPIIFMTAKVQAQELTHYRGLGALDVIAKPFDPMTLASSIRDIWSRYHG